MNQTMYKIILDKYFVIFILKSFIDLLYNYTILIKLQKYHF